MKSLLKPISMSLAVICGLQSPAFANINNFGSRRTSTPSFGIVGEMNADLLKGNLAHVDFSRKLGQWTTKDFEGFVQGLPVHIKRVQIFTYMHNGLYFNGIFLERNNQMVKKITEFINREETQHSIRLFSLMPDGLPGYKVEPHLSRFHPTYVPASGQVRTAQYQENGVYDVLLIESTNADGSVTLVNGKNLKKGQYLLEVPKKGEAKPGVVVLHKSTMTHVEKTHVNPGIIYRVFQDGSIQLTSQRAVYSHIDYELPLQQNGDLKPGVSIRYLRHLQSHDISEGVVAFVYKNHVLLEDRETIVPLEHIQQIALCESYMLPGIDKTGYRQDN